MKVCRVCGEAKPLSDYYAAKVNRDGFQNSCKCCVNKASKAWWQANKDRQKANNLSWVAANKQKVATTHAAWQKANPDIVAAMKARRRARKANSHGSHTAKDVKTLMAVQKCKCAVCRESIKEKYHVDHIVPLAGGGSNDKTNLQLLCPSCNTSKGAKHPIDFMQSRGFLL